MSEENRRKNHLGNPDARSRRDDYIPWMHLTYKKNREKQKVFDIDGRDEYETVRTGTDHRVFSRELEKCEKLRAIFDSLKNVSLRKIQNFEKKIQKVEPCSLH